MSGDVEPTPWIGRRIVPTGRIEPLRPQYGDAISRKINLGVEPLEDRTVPTVALLNGDIHISQTGGNDKAEVSLVGINYRVVDNGVT